MSIIAYDNNYMMKAVSAAALQVAPDLSSSAEVYISGLLTSLIADWLPESFNRPLCLWMAELQNESIYGKALGLRQLGDTALLKIGLFRKAFSDTGLSPSYYVTIAQSAYKQSARAYLSMQLYASIAQCLLATSEQVTEAADVLSVISRKFFPESDPMSMLDHYTFYIDANSEDAKQMLLLNNIIPVPIEIGQNIC